MAQETTRGAIRCDGAALRTSRRNILRDISAREDMDLGPDLQFLELRDNELE